MKVAILVYQDEVDKLFAGLLAGLKKRGHNAKIFYEVGARSTLLHERMHWTLCRIEPLRRFSPDVVVIFNGRAVETSGITSYIERQYPVVFAELGWLPQRTTLYFDRKGLGGRSTLAETDLCALATKAKKAAIEDCFEALRKEYDPGPRPGSLPKNYILVPLQLEHDTSIRLDSPHFKTMPSLVNFVKSAWPGREIVVKPHPKSSSTWKPDGVHWVTDHSVNTLSAYADRIIGINSTSLVEALIHLKPVAALGRSVLSGSNVFMDADDVLRTPRRFLEFSLHEWRAKAALYELCQAQFLCKSPSPKAFALIENT